MKFKIYLIIFFLLGLFLRFYKLSSIPSGITMDEASFGYNAYSILLTGKDEFGKFLPISFRSFADYKSPAYIYFSLPFIAIFGLNVLSLRFVSALFGSLLGIIVYFFVIELFGRKNGKLALISSTVIMFSPWSILFSRGVGESNMGTFFYLLGTVLFIKGIKKNSFNLLLSSIIFVFSIYSYHTEKIITPLTIIALIIIYYKEIVLNSLRKKITVFLLIFIIFSFPCYKLFSFYAGRTRLNNTVAINRDEISSAINNPKEIVPLARRQASLYFAYFSPRNLFFLPDNLISKSFPELSVYYRWMFFPYLLGMYLLFSAKKKENLTILSMLIITPIPASFTRDPFATMRGLPLIIPTSIVIALGIQKICQIVKNKKILLLFSVLIISGSFFSLSRNLFYLFPIEKCEEWNSGYEQLAKELVKYPDSNILLDDGVGVYYSELLFFLKYPPGKFQTEQNQIDLKNYYNIDDWKNTFEFGNYEVRSIEWKKDIYLPQIIIASPLAISPSQAEEQFFEKVFVIIGTDSKVIFNAYKTNPDLKKKSEKK